MPYKNKADANAASRRRWANDASVRTRHKQAQDRWEAENRDVRNTYRADWAQKDRVENKDFYRAREFAREMKNYGTTVEWYRDRLIEQNGLCALCYHLSHHHGTLQRLQVDHDHRCCDVKTKSCGKCLRGLLCANCNILMSYLERFIPDLQPYLQFTALLLDTTWTAKALRYLKHYAEPRRRDS